MPIIALVVALLATAAACTGGDEAATTTSTTGTSTVTVTLPAYEVLAEIGALDLRFGDCWAAPPPTVTTPDAADLDPASGDPTTTIVGSTTTRATAPPVFRVECDGERDGQVYGELCLGASTERGDPLPLAPVTCPGPAELDWPGDRTVRRAAARACLELFEQVFGEDYAASDRTSVEFTPTEGLWATGERRAVCVADDPDPDPDPDPEEG